MKQFRFSLERIQRYKQQLLDAEKNQLAALQQQMADLDANIERLRRDRAGRLAELQRRQAEGLFAAELQKERFLLENAQIQIHQLSDERVTLQKKIDRQMERVVAASRETKSIDKLEEKQREEYRQAETRERNEEISELIMLGL